MKYLSCARGSKRPSCDLRTIDLRIIRLWHSTMHEWQTILLSPSQIISRSPSPRSYSSRKAENVLKKWYRMTHVIWVMLHTMIKCYFINSNRYWFKCIFLGYIFHWRRIRNFIIDLHFISLFKSRFSIPKHVTHRNFLNEKKVAKQKKIVKIVNHKLWSIHNRKW